MNYLTLDLEATAAEITYHEGNLWLAKRVNPDMVPHYEATLAWYRARLAALPGYQLDLFTES